MKKLLLILTLAIVLGGCADTNSPYYVQNKITREDIKERQVTCFIYNEGGSNASMSCVPYSQLKYVPDSQLTNPKATSRDDV